MMDNMEDYPHDIPCPKCGDPLRCYFGQSTKCPCGAVVQLALNPSAPPPPPPPQGYPESVSISPLTIPEPPPRQPKPRKPSASSVGKEPTNIGRWTKAEHDAFVDGLALYGREWKKVAKLIPSRTVVQIRTHAQKYFQKLAKEQGVENAEMAFRGSVVGAPSTSMGRGYDMGDDEDGDDPSAESLDHGAGDAVTPAKDTRDGNGTGATTATGSAKSRGSRAARGARNRTSATKRRRDADDLEAGTGAGATADADAGVGILSGAGAGATTQLLETGVDPSSKRPATHARAQGFPATSTATDPLFSNSEASLQAGYPHLGIDVNEAERGSTGFYPAQGPPGTSNNVRDSPPNRVMVRKAGGPGSAAVGAVGNYQTSAQRPGYGPRGFEPPTPRTYEAAISLVENKTKANLADGKNTPRTRETAMWLASIGNGYDWGAAGAQQAAGAPGAPMGGIPGNIRPLTFESPVKPHPSGSPMRAFPSLPGPVMTGPGSPPPANLTVPSAVSPGTPISVGGGPRPSSPAASPLIAQPSGPTRSSMAMVGYASIPAVSSGVPASSATPGVSPPSAGIAKPNGSVSHGPSSSAVPPLPLSSTAGNPTAVPPTLAPAFTPQLAVAETELTESSAGPASARPAVAGDHPLPATSAPASAAVPSGRSDPNPASLPSVSVSLNHPSTSTVAPAAGTSSSDLLGSAAGNGKRISSTPGISAAPNASTGSSVTDTPAPTPLSAS